MAILLVNLLLICGIGVGAEGFVNVVAIFIYSFLINYLFDSVKRGVIILNTALWTMMVFTSISLVYEWIFVSFLILDSLLVSFCWRNFLRFWAFFNFVYLNDKNDYTFETIDWYFAIWHYSELTAREYASYVVNCSMLYRNFDYSDDYLSRVVNVFRSYIKLLG